MANYTILLIDYEPRSIERFREPLVGAGYKVEIATDGVSGIAAFHRLNPDMVLVEAMIPKKHGFEVCQELKRTPHGRRTPVIITTGVYKGRKYRTQALHIYGCDEYIEKPIAPEQLLEIVSRFLKPGAPTLSTQAAESTPVRSETGGDPDSHDEGGSAVRSAPSSESPAPGGPRTKPSTPEALAKDDTEDEIMACLDALLPSGGSATPMLVEPQTVAVVTAVERQTAVPGDVATMAEEDPFAQMRAELDAELGAFAAPEEFDPAPTPEAMPRLVRSDQVLSPSVLDALPAPEAELTSAPVPTAPPLVAAERPGQVVSFDTKRSRKHKKSERQGKGRSPQAAPSTPAAHATPAAQAAPAPEAVVPRVIEPPLTVKPLTLPRGTLVESELASAETRRGASVWIGAAVGVVAIATIYFVFFRSAPKSFDAVALPAPTENTVESAPIAASSPEIASAAIPTPPPPPAPSSIVPDNPKPASNVAQAPVAKKSSDRPIAPAPTAKVPPAVGAPAGAAPAPTQSAATPTKLQPVKIVPPPAAPPAAPPSSDLDDNVVGVEAVPDSAAVAPATTVAPGTLVAIDEADVMPVSLTRKVPTYSMQARQMRLRGTVMMNVLVNENGTVDQVVLVAGVPGADLNDSAIRAAKSWTYRPATKNGIPVKVWKSEKIVFKL